MPSLTTTSSEQAYVTLDEMLATGASYRRLDYWARRGWLRPEIGGPIRAGGDPGGLGERIGRVGQPGSGYYRLWPAAERDVCALMVRFVNVGLDVAVAADIARRAVQDNRIGARLGDGIHLSWTPRGGTP